jgi:hypothetical protein
MSINNHGDSTRIIEVHPEAVAAAIYALIAERDRYKAALKQIAKDPYFPKADVLARKALEGP